ncbi:MAG: hypothetical protein ACKOQ8_01960 [Micrococcales bacterium]
MKTVIAFVASALLAAGAAIPAQAATVQPRTTNDGIKCCIA